MPMTDSSVPAAIFTVTCSRRNIAESGTPMSGAAVLRSDARAAPAYSTVRVQMIMPMPVL